MLRMIGVQPTSALAHATGIGLEVGETANVELVVGATMESEGDEVLVKAHFCSSRWKRLNGAPMLYRIFTPPLGLAICTRVPRIPRCGFIKGNCTVTRGGLGLVFHRMMIVRAVTVPERLHGTVPWAHDGGAERVAYQLGYRGLDEWFADRGEPVQN